tara:strand:- start:184 stop:432 length:249 start_codon:yes stop_codon:yes gene_type:complete
MAAGLDIGNFAILSNAGGDKFYEHVQSASSATWSVTHNLGKKPSVTVVDSAGTKVIGEVEYVDDNNVTLKFKSTFSGKAYFN